ncbi:MAG: methyltransferase type 11 [Cyanobium sp. CACIAM 14]|nr:MAG: methyltransferase type 11 [Cyanobium sp. CACIAM 14]
MGDQPIRFTDGAGYDRYMGVWSRLAGEEFLDWLAPPPGLRWLDVGCGNGAFTELIARRCAPRELHGIDPSEAQLAFARRQPLLAAAQLRTGDAMDLPYAADAFDAAVMPLVIFFVPEPARGVAEMARVVAPGGWVAAYAWDMEGGGFPYQSLRDGLDAIGVSTPLPPSPEASRPEALRELWTAAGLTDIETLTISVEHSFADFEGFWAILQAAPSAGQALATMGEAERTSFQKLLRARLEPPGGGAITLQGRANAIRGRVPSRSSPAGGGPGGG